MIIKQEQKWFILASIFEFDFGQKLILCQNNYWSIIIR